MYIVYIYIYIQSVSYITANLYSQPSQYRCTQLHYKFAVISEAPSRFARNEQYMLFDPFKAFD